MRGTFTGACGKGGRGGAALGSQLLVVHAPEQEQ